MATRVFEMPLRLRLEVADDATPEDVARLAELVWGSVDFYQPGLRKLRRKARVVGWGRGTVKVRKSGDLCA